MSRLKRMDVSVGPAANAWLRRENNATVENAPEEIRIRVGVVRVRTLIIIVAKVIKNEALGQREEVK
jgi:hypothetical protein